MSARRESILGIETVQACGRVVGPSGKELSCGLYQTISRLELRCGYSLDELLCSARIAPEDDARQTPSQALLGWDTLLSIIRCMFEPRLIKVFIASPGDLATERRAFKDVIDVLNAGFGRGADVRFEPLGWEDALSQVGRG